MVIAHTGFLVNYNKLWIYTAVYIEGSVYYDLMSLDKMLILLVTKEEGSQGADVERTSQRSVLYSYFMFPPVLYAESSTLLEKFSRISLFEVVNGSPNKVLSILPIHIVHRSSLIPFVCEKRFTTINLLLPTERHSPINVYLYPTGREVQILISMGCINTFQWRRAWIVV